MDRDPNLHITLQKVLRQAVARLTELEKDVPLGGVGASRWHVSPNRSPLLRRPAPADGSPLLTRLNWYVNIYFLLRSFLCIIENKQVHILLIVFEGIDPTACWFALGGTVHHLSSYSVSNREV